MCEEVLCLARRGGSRTLFVLFLWGVGGSVIFHNLRLITLSGNWCNICFFRFKLLLDSYWILGVILSLDNVKILDTIGRLEDFRVLVFNESIDYEF